MDMRSLVLHRFHDWTVMEQNHLSAAEIAGFIDRTLTAEVRIRAVEHLATCERCREEVAACARLAGSVPTKKSVPIVWQAVAGMAAILVLAVALRSTWHRQSFVGSGSTVATERSAPTTGRITTVFPADSVAIARSRLRFVWRRDEGATAYLLTITDANGNPVWFDEVRDTAFALPDTVRLTPSVLYFWHVDAPHTNGSSAQSGATGFRVAP